MYNSLVNSYLPHCMVWMARNIGQKYWKYSFWFNIFLWQCLSKFVWCHSLVPFWIWTNLWNWTYLNKHFLKIFFFICFAYFVPVTMISVSASETSDVLSLNLNSRAFFILSYSGQYFNIVSKLHIQPSFP